MVIRKDKGGKYYIAPSPPSFYKSPKRPSTGSGGGSGGSSSRTPSTVPHDFIGPLAPGQTREPAPISGPVRPGVDIGTFRKTGRSVKKEVSKGFIGPLQMGVTRKGAVPTFEVEEPLRKGQIYSPELKGFLGLSEPSGQATGIISPPTLKEQTDIDAAIYAGSFQRLKDESKKALELYKKKVVVPLSESKAFKKYGEKVVKPVGKKVVKPFTKGVMSGIETYKQKVVVPLRKAFPTLGDTPIAQIATAKRMIESKSPDALILVGLPGNIRTVRAGDYQGIGIVAFSKKVYGGEVEKSFTSLSSSLGASKGTSEKIGKGASLVSEFGAYAIPGYFEAEIGAEIGEAALGGKFGGPKNIVEFAKEKPVELALLGALGAVKGVKFIRSTSPEVKYAKLLETPKKKVVVLETEFETKLLKQDIIKPKLKLAIIDDFKVLDIEARTKGKLTSKKFIPKRSQAGEVFELRQIGKKGKKIEKIFKGEVELSGGGIYRETISYSDDLKKVIEINKEGEGMIKILKKNKKIFEKKLKDAHQPKIKLKKPRLEKLKVDKQFGSPGVKIEEVRLERNKKFRDFWKATDETGDQIIYGKKLKLESKLIKAELKSESLAGEDIAEGVKQFLQKEEGFLDIIKVGERKGLARVEGVAGKITKKTRIGQTIEFGIDKEIDTAAFLRRGKKKITLKSITPDIKRDITEFSGQTTTTIFTKPDTKIIKDAAKKAKDLEKKRSLKIKVVEKTKAEKEFEDILSKLEKSQRSKVAARKDLITNKIRNLNKRIAKQNRKIYESKPQASEFAFGERLGPKLDVGQVTFVEPTETFLKGAKTSFKSPPIVKGLTIAKQSPLIGTKGAAAVLSLSKVLERLDNKVRVKIDTKLDSKIDQRSEPSLSEKLDQKVDQEFVKKTSSRITPQLDTRIDTKLDSKIKQGFQSRPAIKPVVAPVPLSKKKQTKKVKTPKLKPSLTPKKEFYMPQAKRNDKWVNLASTGLTKQAARGRGARVVDNTVAAAFKIKPAKKGDKKINDNYFAFNKKKFRDYKIVKGKKVPVVDKWIEKRGRYRLDQKSEKDGLTIAKWLKKKGLAGRRKSKPSDVLRGEMRVPKDIAKALQGKI